MKDLTLMPLFNFLNANDANDTNSREFYVFDYYLRIFVSFASFACPFSIIHFDCRFAINNDVDSAGG